MEDATSGRGCGCQHHEATAAAATRADPRYGEERGAVDRRVVLAGSVATLAALAIGACARTTPTAGEGTATAPTRSPSGTEPSGPGSTANGTAGTDAAGSPTGSPTGTDPAAATSTAGSADPNDPGSGAGSGDPSGGGASGDGGSGEALAGTADFPVGGGVIVTTYAGTVVVTQPADAQFKAFSGRCPHAGCPVTEVKENTILCLCHGSTFDASSGDRLEGPARTGLIPIPITVEGDLIYLS